VTDALEKMNYRNITLKPLPCYANIRAEDAGWYCLLAQKPE